MLHTVLLSSMLLASSAAAGTCSEPPKVAFGVTALHDGVAEGASYSLAEIQALARRSGAAAGRHPPLGFYVSSLAHDVVIRTERRTSPDGSRCGFLTVVTLRLALVNRAVEVAQDFRDRPCLYEAALRHYRKHAAADDAALSRLVGIANETMTAAWPGIEAELGGSGAADEEAVRRVVEPVVGPMLDKVERTRAEAIAAADSREEVETLAKACQIPS